MRKFSTQYLSLPCPKHLLLAALLGTASFLPESHAGGGALPITIGQARSEGKKLYEVVALDPRLHDLWQAGRIEAEKIVDFLTLLYEASLQNSISSDLAQQIVDGYTRLETLACDLVQNPSVEKEIRDLGEVLIQETRNQTTAQVENFIRKTEPKAKTALEKLLDQLKSLGAKAEKLGKRIETSGEARKLKNCGEVKKWRGKLGI